MSRPVTISNKYGSVTLLPVEGPRPIKGVRVADFPAAQWAGIETGEKLALLTEGARSQIVFHYPFTPDQRGLLLLHDSASTVTIMQVLTMEYTGPDPAAQIASDNATRAIR